MAGNKLSEGRVIDLVAPTGGVAAGKMVIISNFCGIALRSAAGGEVYPAALEGHYEVPKLAASGEFWGQGRKIYSDPDGNAREGGANGPPCGMAWNAAATGDTVCEIKLALT